MSRSHKKAPIAKLKCKQGKHLANIRVRRSKLNDHFYNEKSSYKKIYPQYDVYDYVLYWDYKTALDEYRNPSSYINKQFSNEKEFNKYWYKSVIMK